MATIANDGYEVNPHVIYSIEGKKNEDFNYSRKISIGENAFETVKKGLRATVTDFSGTAHVLDMEEFYVAGKTGTAQTTPEKEHHAWFVGYAKGQIKNIAFCVFLEYGGSSHNAAALARQLLMQMYQQNKI